MKSKEIMKSQVDCIAPSDPAEKAGRIMRDRNVGFVPVCDAAGKVIGTLTDRDLAIRVLADGRPGTTPVQEIMSKEVISCSPEDDVERAAALMGKHQKSRMLCVDDSGKLIGVISLSDIASRGDRQQAAETMRQVSSREAYLH
jgi:CBS domain-containing protein